MGFEKKEDREFAGLAFSQYRSDPEAWLWHAKSYKEAVEILAKSGSKAVVMPFYLNAALSLELILKAALVAKGGGAKPTHKLNDLCEQAGIEVSEDQEKILGLLTEMFIWCGRYPTPKKPEDWDNFYGRVLSKHVRREHRDGVFKTLVKDSTYPSLENYLCIWGKFEGAYLQWAP